jgi:hypothetical protein
MENLFRDRKGLGAFLMLMILFVFMLVGLILSLSFVTHTLSFFFGVTDPALFLSSTSEQIKNPPALLYMQAVSSIGAILLPVIAYYTIFSYDMVTDMGMKIIPSFRLWLLGIGVMLFSAIFIQWLVQINSALPLPAAWKSLRTAQDQIDLMFGAFFSDSGLTRFLILTVVMALLPAVAEEFCFRGTIQQTLYRTNLGPLGAIIIGGLSFSLFHGEFNNFLAIWCMGIVLGFLYYYSGSIWLNIAAHFFNNFIIVLGKFAFMRGYVHTDISGDETLPLYFTLPAGVLMIAGLVIMKRWTAARTTSAEQPLGSFD